MKTLRNVLLALLLLSSTAVFAQPENNPAEASPSSRGLTKFDLDFPGGTPSQLVSAIEKATQRPLNAIIPEKHAQWKLPPLKMNGVDVVELFRALELAGHNRDYLFDNNGNPFGGREFTLGFRTAPPQQRTSAPPSYSDETIWYFFLQGDLPTRPKISRYYLLTPYLETGLTVDDITTAIQTGWKMRGEATTPALSFHKETKLLLAFGESGGLDTIDAVLRALDGPKPKVPAPEKTAEEKKTKS